MKDIKDITVLVWDRGTFFPVAERLARDCKRVLYHMPNGEGYRTFAKQAMGDGHTEVEWCPRPMIEKPDLVVFPDCDDSDYQSLYESQGVPVWGSKGSCIQETNRGVWIKTCEKLGLPMPKTHEIRGVTNLRLFFRKHEGDTFHVKISTFRGDMETWKAKEPSQIEAKLDLLAMKFGPFKEHPIFYVQEPVETDIESGCDTYFVDGKYPDKVILGYEKKGESYFATWKTQAEMPPEVWKVSEAIAPLLESYGYCNMVSTEVRINGDESYLLDPCLRFPSPAGEEELEMYENITEIIYHGACGELVQPEMAAKFCGEAIIAYSGDKEGWKSVKVPQEVKKWIKLYASAHEDGVYHFPPDKDPDALGCAVALGDTPTEVLDRLKELREALKDSAVDVKIEPIADLIMEIEKAEAEGIPFTGQKMPEPAEVLED